MTTIQVQSSLFYELADKRVPENNYKSIYIKNFPNQRDSTD